MTSPYERGYMLGRRFRWTAFLAIVAWGIGASATFWWHEDVFKFLLTPAGDQLSPFGGRPIFTSPPDAFGATVALAMNGGLLAAFPIVTVGGLYLLKPLVPRSFWRFVVIYTALIIGLFFTGTVFVYFVMLPVSLPFLLTFGLGFAEPVIILDQYMALLTALFKWIGLIFLLPVFMQLLARFRLLSYRRAGRIRKWVAPTAFIFAALITPSLNGELTFMVAIPMLLLYEVGLVAMWITRPEGENYFADLPMVAKTHRWLRWLVKRPRAILWRVRWYLRKHGLG